ncbi:hypothetical protein MGMO_120c00590 [Methyloglobulus morosus KoM1]|uniref:RDD domain-containing protein n=1 Tax=Methyloglobulus morosus KoM1 TaxID=1116472 RepID=V5BWS5_9GAMM|nr:RDD family protein [Methyloglobulus morosus]ESS70672.1 hypothetical protein MGMO_120c00590 [Methyloglobulus morosus KoM1]
MNNANPSQVSTKEDFLLVQSLEGMDYRMEIAGMGARSHAFIIDWHIRLLLAITWILAVGFALYSKEEIRTLFKHEHLTTPQMVLLIPAGMIYFFYHIVLELVMVGRTPGKGMAGVRLVTLQGRSPTIGAILLRNVFRLVDSLPGLYFIGLLSVALTRNQVRIGDLASGLLLVYDNTVKPKTFRQITNLAIHSNLNPEDQELLLDLLNRWRELSKETRSRLAQQFLCRIGKPFEIQGPTKKTDQALKAALENLLNHP